MNELMQDPMNNLMNDLMNLEMDRCKFERNMIRYDDEVIKFMIGLNQPPEQPLEQHRHSTRIKKHVFYVCFRVAT